MTTKLKAIQQQRDKLDRMMRVAERLAGGEPWVVGSLGQVSQFFRVSMDTIRTWRRTGMPGQKGRWDLSEIVAWRDGRARQEKADKDSPRAKLEGLKADQLALKLALQRRQVVDLEPARRLMIRLANETKTVLADLVDKLLASLPASLKGKGKAEVKRSIEVTLDDVLRRIATLPESIELGEDESRIED